MGCVTTEQVRKWRPLVFKVIRVHYPYLMYPALRGTMRGHLSFADIVQEAMMGVADALKTHRPGGGASLTTWVWRFASQRVYNAAKLSKAKRSFCAGGRELRRFTPLDYEFVMHKCNSGESESEHRDHVTQMMHYIRSEMPKRDVDALLRHAAGERLEVMAKEVGISRQAMSKRLERLRQKAAVAIQRGRRRVLQGV